MGAAGRRKLDAEADLAEEIGVGVVNGQVDEQEPSRSIQPMIRPQIGQDRFGLGFRGGQILDEAGVAGS